MSLKTRFAMAAGIAALALAPALAAAQDRVTVTMRSGERITGEFEDLANDLVYVRVSQHDQRKLPFGEVAIIDFTAGQNVPDNERQASAASRHILVTRDGQIVRGTFQDIEGGPGSAAANRPRTIYFRTESGERRELRPDQVARVYLGPAPGTAVAPGAPANPDEGRWDANNPATVRVPATSGWTDTGISVREGDMVIFNAQGEVRLSGSASDIARPAGSVEGRRADRAPFPSQLAGALIGRVGGQIFGIGNQTQALRMPATGRLELGINDDYVGDNSGEFTVRVTPQWDNRSRRRGIRR